mgnify:CR=1 FL=1
MTKIDELEHHINNLYYIIEILNVRSIDIQNIILSTIMNYQLT